MVVYDQRVVCATDPHITVYYGTQESIATYQAEVFLVYDSAGIPTRMARSNEMILHTGNNPAMGPT